MGSLYRSLLKIQHRRSRDRIRNTKSPAQILQCVSEGVECRYHGITSLRQRCIVSPLADQAICSIACLDDETSLQTGPVCLSTAMRVEEFIFVSRLYTKPDDVEGRHGFPRTNLLQCVVIEGA